MQIFKRYTTRDNINIIKIFDSFNHLNIAVYLYLRNKLLFWAITKKKTKRKPERNNF